MIICWLVLGPFKVKSKQNYERGGAGINAQIAGFKVAKGPEVYIIYIENMISREHW